MNKDYIWWKHGVVYQIYPRSFMDSSGDGVGDLQGIIYRLNHLVELGIDAIWISPIFPSPMADFGYDISDYTDIHPLFGDLQTFDRLLEEAHSRNIRVILDYVPNHTSDQHPWFLESRSSRDNPKRDWYIWRDAKPDGAEPNNWEAFFGGKAWEWDDKTGQYYLHLFLKEQPDLNWRNPDVMKAMHDVLRFWLDRGVDGFRMDVATALIKHPDMPDNPYSYERPFTREPSDKLVQTHVYNINQPEVHDILRGFRRIFDSYDDRVTIGETWVFDHRELVTYYGEHLDELHIPFNFTLMKTPWNARAMRNVIASYYAVIPEGATPNFVLGSHDESRLATRYGAANARAAGMLLLTLRGVPTMYYGDEIGMEDAPIPPEHYQDPQGNGIGISRDPERTPMQWDTSANAGFAPEGVTPWLPLADNYTHENVAVQMQDTQSTLNFYRRLLRLRRELSALHYGDFMFVDSVPQDVLAFIRSADDDRLLVIINFASDEQALDMSAHGGAADTLLTTSFREIGSINLAQIRVHPHEGLLLRLE